MTRRLDGDVRQLLQAVVHASESIVEVWGRAEGAATTGRRGRRPAPAAAGSGAAPDHIDRAVSNSRKYRAAGTPIRLSAWFTTSATVEPPTSSPPPQSPPASRGVAAAGGTLHIRIENQNEGGVRRLTDEECERVFERGVCGPGATATSTGIGLDTVRVAAGAGAGRSAWRPAPRAHAYTRRCIWRCRRRRTVPRADRVLARGSAAVNGVGASGDHERSSAASSVPRADDAAILGRLCRQCKRGGDDGVRRCPRAWPVVLVADDLPINRIILSYQLASICPGCDPGGVER